MRWCAALDHYKTTTYSCESSSHPTCKMSESESERLSPTAGLSQHSTLELAKHDVTTKAPERDNAVVAPEYNRELDAPQVRDLA